MARVKPGENPECGVLYDTMCLKRRDGEITEEEFQAYFAKYCENCFYMSEVCMYGED